MDKQMLEEVVAKHEDKMKPPYREMMQIMGFSVLYDFIEEFGGQNIYLPRIYGVFCDCIKEELCQEFTGENMRALSGKYGLTHKTIKKILYQTNSLTDV